MEVASTRVADAEDASARKVERALAYAQIDSVSEKKLAASASILGVELCAEGRGGERELISPT